MLAALAEVAVEATFFVQGDRLVERPDLARTAVELGHSVQAHCFHHESHHRLSKAQIDADIARLLGAMRSAGLATPRLWRPPYGDIAPGRSHAVAARHGLQLVTWTVETCDWARNSAAEILSELLAEERPAARLEPDAVVLMHDSVGPHTAELVRLVAGEVRSRGWGLGSIGDAVATPERPFNACR